VTEEFKISARVNHAGEMNDEGDTGDETQVAIDQSNNDNQAFVISDDDMIFQG